jgi:hypothetical protein
MRQWMVDPKCLCLKHLAGEHVEEHMFIGCIKKGTSLRGYIDKGLVEVHNIQNRHNELANELIRRGYNHKSPLDCCNLLWEEGIVNSEQNIEELKRRCPQCRERFENAGK